jgi:hypothetical protein
MADVGLSVKTESGATEKTMVDLFANHRAAVPDRNTKKKDVEIAGGPNGNRTRVPDVRGRCPG